MAAQIYDVAFRALEEAELAAWRRIPAAVASDCLNRTQSMSAAIKPISTGLMLCGQARTVTTMVGDCGSICTLIGRARPGEVIVVDAGGSENVAVWGGVMTEEAVHRKLGGAVVDGAVRDVADMRRSAFPMFCRAAVPRGPHQSFGGLIDGTASVAGVPINPGDVVLGDDDGVVVVPLERADEILKAAQAHLVLEEEWVNGIRSGLTIEKMFDMPEPEELPG